MAFDRIQACKEGTFDQSVEIRNALMARLRPEIDRINREVDPKFRQARREKLIEDRVAQHKASKGVCHSLCLTWMKKKLTSHGRDRDRMRQLVPTVDRAIGRQALFGDAYAAVKRQNVQDRSEAASADSKARLGLREVGVVARWQAINADIAAKSIDTHMREGLLMLYDLYRQDLDPAHNTWIDKGVIGSHAVAWYLSAGLWGMGLCNQHVYLFDPNCGEYRLSKSSLAGFMQNYLDDVRDAFSAKDAHGNFLIVIQPYCFSLTAYASGPSTADRLAKALPAQG